MSGRALLFVVCVMPVLPIAGLAAGLGAFVSWVVG